MKHYLLLLLTALTLGSTAASAQQSYTPLVREGVEWGYVEFFDDYHPYSFVNYYRLQFSGTTEIGGVTYHNLYKYYDFRLYTTEVYLNDPRYSRATIVAYMRETPDGKVYIVYPEDNAVYYRSYEQLAYDFGVKAGGSYITTDNALVQCKDITAVSTADGDRRCYNLDFTYDKLIEGIGPVGDNDISMPFRVYTTCFPECEASVRLLYERKVTPVGSEQYWLKSDIVYKAPDFDTLGIHDPSVWHWAVSKNTDALPTLTSDQTAIKFATEGGMPTILCADEPISTVRVYDINGQLLNTVSPGSHSYAIPAEMRYGILTVVEVTTATHHATCKMLY